MNRARVGNIPILHIKHEDLLLIRIGERLSGIEKNVNSSFTGLCILKFSSCCIYGGIAVFNNDDRFLDFIVIEDLSMEHEIEFRFIPPKKFVADNREKKEQRYNDIRCSS